MTTATEPNQDDEMIRIDVLKFIQDYWRVTLRTAFGAAIVVAALGASYMLFWQPVRTTATLAFRPTFAGAADGHYPNDLPFGPGDITAPSVLDQVFERNHIQDYCGRDEFRSGFFVDQRSMALGFLAADYETRLADAKISAIERTRLQAEYEAKRVALPLGFAMVFVRPANCRSIPTVVMAKALTDALSIWAEDAESKRGVLKLNVDVLTPSSLDADTIKAASPIVRADLILAGLRRLIANIEQVRMLPGAALVRSGEKRLTFLEVKTKVEDLVQSGLEPLVIAAGRGMGSDSILWVDEALASAIREQKLAASGSQAYLDALREYSGASSSAAAVRPDSRQAPTGSSDVQTLAPQIDRTFIDRIVELSAPNMVFRQEMTRKMIDASVEAVRQQGNVLHYQHLADVLRRPGSSGLTTTEIADRMQSIVDSGKALAKQFDDLYDEFSRVSLRASASMYQIEGPVQTDVIRGFTMRSYILSVAGAFFVTLVLMIAVCLVWSRLTSTSAAAN